MAKSGNMPAMGSGLSELWARLRFVLLAIVVYRTGAHIPVHGINPDQLAALFREQQGTILGMFNMFSGGALERMSVLALGIMPYISASIIMQLMTAVSPHLEQLKKEGEAGRRKISQYTRYGTVILALVQATGMSVGLASQGIAYSADFSFYFTAIITFVSGAVFMMWLGEQITEKGIGNGISLLIMIGIVATLPQAFFQELVTQLSPAGGGWIKFLLEIVAIYLVFLFAIAITQAVRQIPLEYAKRVAGGSSKTIGRSYLPIRVNASGVMPIIFAQALMFIPLTVVQYTGLEGAGATWMVDVFGNIQGFWYNFVFAMLILVFTYFYTAIQINTTQIADDLKRNGGFVPGIKPGEATGSYIDDVLAKITLPGAILLAAIAILPSIAMTAGMNMQWAQFYGGTSLLIIVGVVLDTLMQVESYLLNSHYDGLMDGGRLSGRNNAL